MNLALLCIGIEPIPTYKPKALEPHHELLLAELKDGRKNTKHLAAVVGKGRQTTWVFMEWLERQGYVTRVSEAKNTYWMKA